VLEGVDEKPRCVFSLEIRRGGPRCRPWWSRCAIQTKSGRVEALTSCSPQRLKALRSVP